jgi:HSP20 family protein
MSRETRQADQMNQQDSQSSRAQGNQAQGSGNTGNAANTAENRGANAGSSAGAVGSSGTQSGDAQSSRFEQSRPINTTRENDRGGQGAQGTQAGQGMGMQGSRAGQGMQRSAGGMGRRSPMMFDRNAALSNPFALMQRMTEDMDHLFDQLGFGAALRPSSSLGMLGDRGLLGSQPGRSMSRMASDMWMPQIETTRRGDRFVVRADVPGVKKEDLQIDVEDGVLTLSGERREENTEERDGFYRSERSYGRFHRAIPLPEGADPEGCEATFRDGVLEVSLSLPKNEQKSRRIEIR